MTLDEFEDEKAEQLKRFVAYWQKAVDQEAEGFEEELEPDDWNDQFKEWVANDEPDEPKE